MSKTKQSGMIKMMWVILIQLCLISPLYSQYKGFTIIKDPTLLTTSIRDKTNIIERFSSEVDIIYSHKFNTNKHTEKASLFFIKSNSFAWKYNYPNTYTITILNNEASTNENGFTEEYILDQDIDFKLTNKLFLTYYNSSLLESKEYKESYYKNELTYLIRLFPLNNSISNTYNNIELIINKIDFGLVGIRFNKVDNSIVNYIFNERIINGLIDKDIFEME